MEGGFPGKSIARACVSRHGCNPGAANGWTAANQLPPGGEDVALYDGHVEYSRIPNMWNYYWHANWNTSTKVQIGTPY